MTLGQWDYLNPFAGYMVTEEGIDGWYLTRDGVGKNG